MRVHTDTKTFCKVIIFNHRAKICFHAVLLATLLPRLTFYPYSFILLSCRLVGASVKGLNRLLKWASSSGLPHCHRKSMGLRDGLEDHNGLITNSKQDKKAEGSAWTSSCSLLLLCLWNTTKTERYLERVCVCMFTEQLYKDKKAFWNLLCCVSLHCFCQGILMYSGVYLLQAPAFELKYYMNPKPRFILHISVRLLSF